MSDRLAAIADSICTKIPGADRDALLTAALRSLAVRAAVRGAMLDSLQPRGLLEIPNDDHGRDMEGAQC